MGSYEEMFKIDPTPGLIKVTEENRGWRKRLMCVETFPVPEPMRDEEEKGGRGGRGWGGGGDVLPEAWETDRAFFFFREEVGLCQA